MAPPVHQDSQPREEQLSMFYGMHTKMCSWLPEGWGRDPRQFWPLLFTETFPGRGCAPKNSQEIIFSLNFFIYSLAKINVTYLGDVSYFIKAQPRHILDFLFLKFVLFKASFPKWFCFLLSKIYLSVQFFCTPSVTISKKQISRDLILLDQEKNSILL